MLAVRQCHQRALVVLLCQQLPPGIISPVRGREGSLREPIPEQREHILQGPLPIKARAGQPGRSGIATGRYGHVDRVHTVHEQAGQQWQLPFLHKELLHAGISESHLRQARDERSALPCGIGPGQQPHC